MDTGTELVLVDEFTDWTGPDHIALFIREEEWFVVITYGSGSEKPSLRSFAGEVEARHAYRLTVEHWEDVTGGGDQA